MKDIVLYCKSYHRDVLRAARLAESVRRHNPGNLPFYLSCPSTDLPLFKDIIGSEGVTFFADEEIVAGNSSIKQKDLFALPGGLSQQIVKSEFWRLGICENYLCIDSDAYFIRGFNKEDFLEPRGMNFLEAIKLFPSEMRWYGEALLKFKSIELWPVETLFRCYHYEEQFRDAKKSGETDKELSQIYLGVCVQSNWDSELAYGDSKKSFLSRSFRAMKRRILRRLV